MTQNILNILNSLSSTTKRSEKEAILIANKNNELLKRVIHSTLDEYTNYYIKKIPTYTTGLAIKTLDEAIDGLSLLSTRALTGNAGIQHLAHLLGSLSADDAVVLERIIKRDLRCGVSTATANKVFKGLVKAYPMLLASPYSVKLVNAFNFPAILQLKSDGARCNIRYENGKIDVFSRSGRSIDLGNVLDADIKRFAEKVGYNFVLDGELVGTTASGKLMSRKQGNGLVSKAIKGTISESEAKQIGFHTWDIIPVSEFDNRKGTKRYEDRFNELTSLLDDKTITKIMLIESEVVYDLERVLTVFQEKLDMGLEGVMLKSMDSLWSDTRSQEIIKFKAERTAELKITGWNPGTGKFTGMVGSIIMESADGIVEVSVSGMSDELRSEVTADIDNMVANEQIATVMYNEKITKKTGGKKSLFLPRLKAIRSDKSVADTDDLIG